MTEVSFLFLYLLERIFARNSLLLSTKMGLFQLQNISMTQEREREERFDDYDRIMTMMKRIEEGWLRDSRISSVQLIRIQLRNLPLAEGNGG